MVFRIGDGNVSLTRLKMIFNDNPAFGGNKIEVEKDIFINKIHSTVYARFIDPSLITLYIDRILLQIHVLPQLWRRRGAQIL